MIKNFDEFINESTESNAFKKFLLKYGASKEIFCLNKHLTKEQLLKISYLIGAFQCLFYLTGCEASIFNLKR